LFAVSAATSMLLAEVASVHRLPSALTAVKSVRVKPSGPVGGT
jgi:hypothetical protein